MNELMTVISSLNEICDLSDNMLLGCRRNRMITKADLEVLKYKLDTCIAKAKSDFEISEYNLKKARCEAKLMCLKDMIRFNMKLMKGLVEDANNPNLTFEEHEFAMEQINILSKKMVQELEKF